MGSLPEASVAKQPACWAEYFQCVGYLGQGGFGKCVRAVDTRNDLHYAVKVIQKKTLVNRQDKRMVQNEVKLQRELHHENIVRIHGACEDTEYVYMFQELCHHGSLKRLLGVRGVLREAECRCVISKVTAACQYLHDKQIVHRDLKPDNVLLTADLDVKVGDLGLARRLGEGGGGRLPAFCGTVNYMAPEVLSRRECGLSADMWALGCVLYELLYGRPPFMHADGTKTRKHILLNKYKLSGRSGTGSSSLTRLKHKLRPRSGSCAAGREVAGGGEVSVEARSLIRDLLQSDPAARPEASSLPTHPFLAGLVPARLPASSLRQAPEDEELLACALAGLSPPDASCVRLKQSDFNRETPSDLLRAHTPVTPRAHAQSALHTNDSETDHVSKADITSLPSLPAHAQCVWEPCVSRKRPRVGSAGGGGSPHTPAKRDHLAASLVRDSMATHARP